MYQLKSILFESPLTPSPAVKKNIPVAPENEYINNIKESKNGKVQCTNFANLISLFKDEK